MALFNIHICIPTNISHTPPFLSGFVNFEVGFLLLITIWYLKPKMPAIIAQPHFVIFHKWENFAIR